MKLIFHIIIIGLMKFFFYENYIATLVAMATVCEECQMPFSLNIGSQFYSNFLFSGYMVVVPKLLKLS